MQEKDVGEGCRRRMQGWRSLENVQASGACALEATWVQNFLQKKVLSKIKELKIEESENPTPCILYLKS